MKILILLMTIGASVHSQAMIDLGAESAARSIKAERLADSIRTLSSTEFGGRGPGTDGEEKTTSFIVENFKKLGLAPGNPDGRYVQDVPLVGSTPSYSAQIALTNGKTFALTPNQDFVGWSRRQTPKVEIKNSDLVFVGYGVVAPEYGWDDYKDVDVRGKTIVMLVNDPQIPDPQNPSRLDPKMFKGKAMTYYGRWTYKYEIAAQKGAAGAIIVHETEGAAYPFSVVIDSNGRETFSIVDKQKNAGLAGIEAWTTQEKAREILKACGQDYDALKKAALSKSFRPVALTAKFSADLALKLREVNSKNIVGKIEGADAAKSPRYLIYSAHWDHLGIDPNREGDRVYHGAIDNASGVAALLETARAFKALKTPPKATILFIATTAEEKGLLGARYYAENPLYPIARTLADLNYDGVGVWGKTRDLQLVGDGKSTLEDALRNRLRKSNRSLIAEDDPEKGMFYRNDSFEFSRVGVPSIWYKSGIDIIGKPKGFGVAKREEYTARNYHKPADVMSSEWNLAGAAEDVGEFVRLGYEIAQNSAWPEWKAGSEFRAVREKSEDQRAKP